MARNTWDLFVKTTGAWVKDFDLYVPNDNFLVGQTSTQSKIILADGESAFFTPSTKYIDDIIIFIWYGVDNSFKTTLKGYITNGIDIKITDDQSDDYVGRFVSFRPTRIKGQDTNEYDIEAVFEIVSSLA